MGLLVFRRKIALEGFAARLAAERITGEQAARLNRALEEIALATEEHDLDAWHEADQRFHGILFDAAGNPRLQQIVSGLNNQLHRIRASHLALKGRMDRSLEEHRAIAETVLSGDGQAAEEVMRAHLRDLRESVIGALEDLIVPFVGPRL
jgi:DNA-binding GntR family transcriptional regulator